MNKDQKLKAIEMELKLIAQYEKKITKLKSQRGIDRYKDYIKWGYEEIERINSGYFERKEEEAAMLDAMIKENKE